MAGAGAGGGRMESRSALIQETDKINFKLSCTHANRFKIEFCELKREAVDKTINLI